jgi:hypothetical protein
VARRIVTYYTELLLRTAQYSASWSPSVPMTAQLPRCLAVYSAAQAIESDLRIALQKSDLYKTEPNELFEIKFCDKSLR